MLQTPIPTERPSIAAKMKARTRRVKRGSSGRISTKSMAAQSQNDPDIARGRMTALGENEFPALLNNSKTAPLKHLEYVLPFELGRGKSEQDIVRVVHA